MSTTINASEAEVKCREQIYLEENLPPPATNHCKTLWDELVCWPRTPAGEIVSQNCPREFRGIFYFESDTVLKLCQETGDWEAANYSKCREDRENEPESLYANSATLYFVGYTLSLLSLCIAVAIFLYLKDLRCLRNIIHTNLLCTYFLADSIWMFDLIIHLRLEPGTAMCIILDILVHYFHMTTFFWMFVEGLYLYILVVKTFIVEKLKLRVYMLIGWVVPAAIVAVWATARSFGTGIESGEIVTSINEHNIRSDIYITTHCPWMFKESLSDWLFYKAPVLLVLCINLVFLVMIMWVLITKLRSANTTETQQYRKATKALLVLIPLLGLTYILMIYGPTKGVFRDYYNYLLAVVISTQGFTVALFYCFLNTEVQNSLRQHLNRWRTTRNLGGGGRRSTYSGHSKDWSPRSRTESLRLSTQPANVLSGYRKRESTASETTMTTLVGGSNNGGRSNGRTVNSPFLASENAV